MRIVLLGLPGAGKSTQSALLSDHYSLPVVSAGALLRAAVKRGDAIGAQVEYHLRRGELAPNHLVDRLVFGKLGLPEGAGGFILDGFPRTLGQAGSLDRFVQQMGWQLWRVIFLAVSDTVAISRLNARRVCPVCGAIYSLAGPPRQGDRCYACHSLLRYVRPDTIACELCGVPFVLREDDTPSVLGRRLEVQKTVLKEVLAHYRETGLLVEIDGNRTTGEVLASICALLDGKQAQAGGAR